jgi:hypothetical protein
VSRICNDNMDVKDVVGHGERCSGHGSDGNGIRSKWEFGASSTRPPTITMSYHFPRNFTQTPSYPSQTMASPEFPRSTFADFSLDSAFSPETNGPTVRNHGHVPRILSFLVELAHLYTKSWDVVDSEHDSEHDSDHACTRKPWDKPRDAVLP